jgi:hypothetical protein
VTGKSSGVITPSGTESVLFIDSFAVISDQNVNVVPGQKPRTAPILGFLPKNDESIVWKSTRQSEPVSVDTQRSVLLHSDKYQFAAIQNMPNWLGTIDLSLEDRMLAEACQRCFADADGDAVKALTSLVQDKSSATRALGYRLWGDLGEFTVPLTMVRENKKEHEAIRLTLRQYIDDVMLRDEETVNGLSEALEAMRR